MSKAPIEFYFDFSSPYGFLAARVIDEKAAEWGREVVWKPYLMGVVMKETNVQPLLTIPVKGKYAYHDVMRHCRYYGIEGKLPEQFPFISVAAARAFYALTDAEPETAKRLARALFERAFIAGQSIAKPEEVLSVAESIGLDRDVLAESMNSPETKERLRQEVEASLEKGVFGSPFFIVDGEPFWGHDRLRDVGEWLQRGGW
jgi:2-hydroxychromene-2-carboxylate isomerase